MSLTKANGTSFTAHTLHRLDNHTSGLLCFAKHPEAARRYLAMALV